MEEIQENGETAKGEALYYEGVHLYASWLAQALLASSKRQRMHASF